MKSNKDYTIRYVDFTIDYENLKSIFIDYQQYLGLDLCFQDFENELNSLNKIYALPNGSVLIAENSLNEIIGCVALKPLSAYECEMKRLYVKQNGRGLGLGFALVNEIIQFARKAGYSTMKLDTLTSLKEAISLYKKLGFEETEAYVFNPLNEVIYLKLNL